MDREQIISMEDEQLAMAVSKVFGNMTPHDLYPSMELQVRLVSVEGTQKFHGDWECKKCHEWFNVEDVSQIDTTKWPKVTLIEGRCSEPMEVKDLGKVMEVYRSLGKMKDREYVKICGPVFQKAGWKLFNDDLVLIYCIKEWILEEATPQQIWKICMLARETKQSKTTKN